VKKILICFFNFFLFIQPVQSSLPHFSHYVIFGDSLTDVGNYTTTSKNCVYFNAPITNHNDDKSKYTNSTWANAGEFKSILASNDGGTNYAVAGYTTAQILTSVKNYKTFHHAKPDTLYIIWAGTNDVLSTISGHWSDETVQQALIDGTNNIILSMNNLYDIGARNFLIIGLMDLSQTPMSTYPQADPENILGVFANTENKSRLHNMCHEWNKIFFHQSPSTQKKLTPFKNQHQDAHIYIWNPTPLLTSMMNNPAAFGYPNHLKFNLHHSNTKDRHYHNYQITYCGNTANDADRNPDHYLFYNFIHPTPSAYHIIQQELVKNSTEI